MRRVIVFLSIVLVGLPGILGTHQEGSAVNQPESVVDSSVQGQQSLR